MSIIRNGTEYQNTLSKEEQHSLGAHYTNERTIYKLIKPLFLDALYCEFERVKKDKEQLEIFHDKLSSLTFLDPACRVWEFPTHYL